MTWTADGVIAALYIAVAIMLLIVLYHALFIVVDLRKITRRFENLTSELEAVLLKPISIADKGFDWIMGFLHGDKHHKK